MLITLNARFTIDGNKWHRLNPKISDAISIEISSESTWISKDDWIKASNFVSTNEKIKGYEEILSHAKWHNANGLLRTAISEAVSALELQFDAVKNIRKEKFPTQILVDPNIDILRHMDHLGFSVSFDTILPLSVKESEVKNTIFRECYEAILLRNNVLHNGQRRLEKYTVRKLINSIKDVCKFFEDIKNDEIA